MSANSNQRKPWYALRFGCYSATSRVNNRRSCISGCDRGCNKALQRCYTREIWSEDKSPIVRVLTQPLRTCFENGSGGETPLESWRDTIFKTRSQRPAQGLQGVNP